MLAPIGRPFVGRHVDVDRQQRHAAGGRRQRQRDTLRRQADLLRRLEQRLAVGKTMPGHRPLHRANAAKRKLQDGIYPVKAAQTVDLGGIGTEGVMQPADLGSSA